MVNHNYSGSNSNDNDEEADRRAASSPTDDEQNMAPLLATERSFDEEKTARQKPRRVV